MPSGGARARSGPAPDPNAFRRERKDDQATWIDLPPARLEPAPEFPLPRQTVREVELWKREWARPQAVEWERLGLDVEVALYVRSLAEVELPGAPIGLRKEVRIMQASLGITIDGLLKNRWRITNNPQAATATTAPAARPSRGRTTSSAKQRFAVVPAPEEGA
jgi:hypothetical protein